MKFMKKLFQGLRIRLKAKVTKLVKRASRRFCYMRCSVDGGDTTCMITFWFCLYPFGDGGGKGKGERRREKGERRGERRHKAEMIWTFSTPTMIVHHSRCGKNRHQN